MSRWQKHSRHPKQSKPNARDRRLARRQVYREYVQRYGRSLVWEQIVRFEAILIKRRRQIWESLIRPFVEKFLGIENPTITFQ